MQNCTHKRPYLAEYTINGLQEGMLLVTCPDCGSTLVYKGEYQVTEVTTSLSDIAAAMASPNVDLMPCLFAVDMLSDQAKTELDQIFALHLRTRIDCRIKRLQKAG